MMLALAQISSTLNNTRANLKKHKDCITLAKTYKANAIFFPELSLTGYSTKNVSAFELASNNPLLNELQNESKKHNIVVSVGVPLKQQNKLYISLITYFPNNTSSIYKKQWLHDDEKPYFNSGGNQINFSIANTTIVPAICYESLVPEHLKKTLHLQPFIYLISAAKPLHSLNKAHKYYAEISKQHKTPVLFVNSIGACDDFIAGGNTGVWNDKGELISCLDKKTEGLLIVNTEQFTAQKVSL